METIKSYTDLEQSRKLAEILPLESADMWYQYIGISIKDGSEKPIYFPMVIRDCESDEDIPCWSLAALLSVLPNGTNISTPDPLNKVRACNAFCKVCKMPKCNGNECKWISNFKKHLENI